MGNIEGNRNRTDTRKNLNNPESIYWKREVCLAKGGEEMIFICLNWNPHEKCKCLTLGRGCFGSHLGKGAKKKKVFSKYFRTVLYTFFLKVYNLKSYSGKIVSGRLMLT